MCIYIDMDIHFKSSSPKWECVWKLPYSIYLWMRISWYRSCTGTLMILNMNLSTHKWPEQSFFFREVNFTHCNPAILFSHCSIKWLISPFPIQMDGTLLRVSTVRPSCGSPSPWLFVPPTYLWNVHHVDHWRSGNLWIPSVN